MQKWWQLLQLLSRLVAASRTDKTPTAASSKTKTTLPGIRKYIMGLKTKKGSTYFFTRPHKVSNTKKITSKKLLKVPVPALTLHSTPSKRENLIQPTIQTTPSQREILITPLYSTPSKGDHFILPKMPSTPSERAISRKHDKEERVQKEMFNWLLEPDEVDKKKKLKRSTSDLDSMATLAQRIQPFVDLEPINLSNTSTISLVDDW